jgi:ribosomal protein S7
MRRIKPKLKNKLNIPVNIYKGEVPVKEAESIQKAARWLKEDTGDRFKRSLPSQMASGIINPTTITAISTILKPIQSRLPSTL